MEKKIQNAIYALYGGALASFAMAIHSYLEIEKIRSSFVNDPSFTAMIPSGFTVFPVIILVASFFVAKELKAKTKWSWVSALAVLTVNSSGFLILFSIYGAIQLLDREVRNYFMKQMEIDIG